MHSRNDIGALLSEHGLAPRRDLGQNFVVDPNTVRRIARLAGVGPGDHVVEIGAGLGSLTLALAETGAAVTAVEVDHGLAGALREVVAGLQNVTVVEADAMRLDWAAICSGADRWVLVANLPYNVATPLVCDLLDDVPAVERMLVMVQREVGERLCAAGRRRGLRRGQREGGVLGDGANRRARCRRPCSCRSPRSSRRWSTSAAARARRSTWLAEQLFESGADRVRTAPQDAAPLTCRCRRSRGVRAAGVDPQRVPRSSTSTSGAR